MHMKQNTALKIIAIVLATALIGYVVYANWRGSKNEENNNTNTTTENNEGVICTMDAKLCPDGSYVGRVSPNCEFAPCPGATSTGGWKTTADLGTGISFQYPESLSTKYISVIDWPPQIQVLNKLFVCTQAGSPTARAGETIMRVVNGREFCITKKVEGAAGSIYTQYAYAFGMDNKTVIAAFSLKEVQCGNYDNPQKTECENERVMFDIDALLETIAATVKKN